MLGNIMYIFLAVVVSGICFYLTFGMMKEQFQQELEETALTRKQLRAKRREHTRKVWLFEAAALIWLASIVIALWGSDSIVAIILTVAAIIGLGYLLVKHPSEKQTTAIKILSVALGLGFGLVLGTMIKAGTATYFMGICFAIALPLVAHFVGKANIDDIDDDDDEELEAEVEVEDEESVRETVTAQPAATRNEPVRPATQSTAGYRPARTNNSNANHPTRHQRSGLRAEDAGGERNFDTYVIEQLSKTEEGREQLLQLLRANR